ncbi:Phosphatidylinositol 4,5-bisphosphate 3-kinase catalytic subunit gamma isoform [Aphanomyces cochlioides]|nr:Phosphatidylinositol 4,5-bisphosphate 3-kinase catalytic subunit gamma isoform [Aphanomyces cochlioides]
MEESQYGEWVDALCHAIRYDSVSIIYRRMLQLGIGDLLPPNAKWVILLPSYTVQETVEHCFECFCSSPGSPLLHPYDPRDYVLKVNGLTEYMTEPDKPLSSHSHARECLVTKQTLYLTLVPKSDIELTFSREPHQKIQTTASSSTLEPSDVKQRIEDHFFPSSQCTSPLRVSLHQVGKIPKEYLDDVSRTPLRFQNCIVVAEFVYAGRVVESIGKSEFAPLRADGDSHVVAVWKTPIALETRLPVRNIPREARIVLTVYNVKQDGMTTQNTRMLSTAWNVFDIDGCLASGHHIIECSNSAQEWTYGPLPKISTLANEARSPYVEITLSVPVAETDPPSGRILFDWNVTEAPPQMEIPKNYSQRSSELGRAGWLYLKKIMSIQVRRLWVVLAIDVIQLENARIEVSHDAEKQFTIHTMINLAELSMSTETVEERLDWIQALTIVAKTDLVSWTNFPLGSLREAILTNPLRPFTPLENKILWRNRAAFMDCFEALPRVLNSVNWFDPHEVNEIADILHKWAPAKQPANNLALLSKEYVHPAVREFATDKLSTLSVSSFSLYLPQMVQALKYEPHHVGFDFFWRVHVETYNGRYRERFGVLLNSFLDSCPAHVREMLEVQHKLFSQDGELDRLCRQLKSLGNGGMKDDELTQTLRERLTTINADLPRIPIPLPINAQLAVSEFVVGKCRLTPELNLWLEFKTFDDNDLRYPIVVIFKSGVDGRSESFALQLIQWMEGVWRMEDLDLPVDPVRCIPTGPLTSMVQVKEYAVTIDSIRSNGQSIFRNLIGSGKRDDLLNWLNDLNDSVEMKTTKKLYCQSTAGCCVAAYILGLGNQREDNMTITIRGRLRLTEFGQIIHQTKAQEKMNSRGKSQVKPFVLTEAMVKVLESTSTTQKFLELVGQAASAVRGNLHLLVSLCLLMVPADMPQLKDTRSIDHVVTAFSPSLLQDWRANLLSTR